MCDRLIESKRISTHLRWHQLVVLQIWHFPTVKGSPRNFGDELAKFWPRHLVDHAFDLQWNTCDEKRHES